MNGPQIQFIGRIVRDPDEVRYTAARGTAVGNLRVAVNTYTHNSEQETTYFDVTLWGRHAENALNRCRQGMEVYVQGTYSYREYTRRDGQAGCSHEVNTRDFHPFFTGSGIDQQEGEEANRERTPEGEKGEEGAPEPFDAGAGAEEQEDPFN